MNCLNRTGNEPEHSIASEPCEWWTAWTANRSTSNRTETDDEVNRTANILVLFICFLDFSFNAYSKFTSRDWAVFDCSLQKYRYARLKRFLHACVLQWPTQLRWNRANIQNNTKTLHIQTQTDITYTAQTNDMSLTMLVTRNMIVWFKHERVAKKQTPSSFETWNWMPCKNSGAVSCKQIERAGDWANNTHRGVSIQTDIQINFIV